MIDTHCHLDSPRFDPDRDAVLRRAWAAGVTGIVVPGIGPDEWPSLLDWPSRDARIHIGLGIHPQLLPELAPADDERNLELLDTLLSRGNALAVGECGIDGPSLPGAPLERQLAVMERHFDLADKHGLPVLLHVFRLHPAMRDFLKRRGLPKAGLLMHSFSGGIDFAKLYARLGCHFSFAGPVTYEGARKPLEALKAIPLDRLMFETDAPDQAPHPHRGERSEPAYVKTVIAGAAGALGLEAAELERSSTEVAARFFRRIPS